MAISKKNNDDCDLARHRLARSGHRVTRQKQIVLEAVRSAPGHPDAHAVYTRARRLLPNISLGTVYRNLGLLRDAGLIRELQLGKSHRCFEAVREPHYHVVCRSCGRIEDLPIPRLNLISKAQRLTDFEIGEQHLEFYGLCPNCRTHP
jgi:Fur family peroxide stress response transcriptional regulator